MLWLWRKVIKPILDGIGHAETIHTIAQAEFLRTLLLPTVTAVATGAAGIFGHIPLMWVIATTAIAFMGAAQGVLSASTYLERKNPAYKLQVLRTLFNYDLIPITGPNRRHRKAAAAQGGLPAVPAFRHIVKGQLGFEVWNRSSFPLSIIATAAETEIEGLKPPRAKYPKEPVIIQPGTTIWIGNVHRRAQRRHPFGQRSQRQRQRRQGRLLSGGRQADAERYKYFLSACAASAGLRLRLKGATKRPCLFIR